MKADRTLAVAFFFQELVNGITNGALCVLVARLQQRRAQKRPQGNPLHHRRPLA
jgi:hypothetical protein